MKYATTTKKKGIHEAAGTIIGKCQIILEDTERAYNKMINRNTRQNKQEYRYTRKEAQDM